MTCPKNMGSPHAAALGRAEKNQSRETFSSKKILFQWELGWGFLSCCPRLVPTPLYLCQAGVLVHHLRLVHGRQLLQHAPAVGQRPRQPRKLGPACGERRKKGQKCRQNCSGLIQCW